MKNILLSIPGSKASEILEEKRPIIIHRYETLDDQLIKVWIRDTDLDLIVGQCFYIFSTFLNQPDIDRMADIKIDSFCNLAGGEKPESGLYFAWLVHRHVKFTKPIPFAVLDIPGDKTPDMLFLHNRELKKMAKYGK